MHLRVPEMVENLDSDFSSLILTHASQGMMMMRVEEDLKDVTMAFRQRSANSFHVIF